MKYFIIEHKIDWDDHGMFTGWEIIEEDRLNKYKEMLKEAEEAFDDGFEYEYPFFDDAESYDYDRLSDIFDSAEEISKEEKNIIQKYTKSSKWDLLKDIFEDDWNEQLEEFKSEYDD